jgi:hypothetical protein
LRKRAQTCREVAAFLSFIGTQGPMYQHMIKSASGYDFLADTIEEGSLPPLPQGYIISRP